MTELTPLRIINTWLLARAKTIEQSARVAYRSAPISFGYWAMLDLRGSASYRQVAGDESSYVRAQTFFGLARELVAEYPSAAVFKELGDGLLIRSVDFRDILEIGLLIDAVNQYWRSDTASDPAYPSLECRMAVSMGEAVSVGDDYLGVPIDLVARLSGVKYDGPAEFAVVHDEVRTALQTRIEKEYPFVSFGPSLPVPSEALKSGERGVRMSMLSVDRAQANGFLDYFTPVRRLATGGDGR